MKSPAIASLMPRKTAAAFRRQGFTLVELLAATLISLLVMAATVTLFGVVGDKISYGRSSIELSDRLRAAQFRLRSDLRGATAEMLPWDRPERGDGYFEILKVPGRDSQPSANNTLLGYTQDALLFTTRSKDLPFVGRFGNTTIESQMAEVVWFLQPTLNSQGQPLTPPTYTLYRRQLLVIPAANFGAGSALNFYDSYDISAHPNKSGDPTQVTMIANSLTDLTYRDNRFGHFLLLPASVALASFPYPVQAAMLAGFLGSGPNASVRFGEDVVLTNVLSFDVKVWDPGAAVEVSADGVTPLVPSDPGWSAANIGNGIALGAYVDLNYNGGFINGSPSLFAGPYYGLGQKSLLAAPVGGLATYDTWSAGYEFAFNGVTGTVVNGFDDDGNNGVDDPNERQTCPPYPVPLRGVQVKIRVYEPSSRQVREVTVDETFLPD
jgi:prepilin-type N-terminal cleavage/methylation domain-containing protein